MDSQPHAFVPPSQAVYLSPAKGVLAWPSDGPNDDGPKKRRRVSSAAQQENCTPPPEGQGSKEEGLKLVAVESAQAVTPLRSGQV